MDRDGGAPGCADRGGGHRWLDDTRVGLCRLGLDSFISGLRPAWLWSTWELSTSLTKQRLMRSVPLVSCRSGTVGAGAARTLGSAVVKPVDGATAGRHPETYNACDPATVDAGAIFDDLVGLIPARLSHSPSQARCRRAIVDLMGILSGLGASVAGRALAGLLGFWRRAGRPSDLGGGGGGG